MDSATGKQTEPFHSSHVITCANLPFISFNQKNAMIQMKMSEGGRVVIPVEIRQALGLREGDSVLFDLVDGEARITTRAAQRQRARALVRQFVPINVSLVNELCVEREAESATEPHGE